MPEAYTFDSVEDHTAFLDACDERGPLVEWEAVTEFSGRRSPSSRKEAEEAEVFHKGFATEVDEPF